MGEFKTSEFSGSPCGTPLVADEGFFGSTELSKVSPT